jgi:3-carboxy-cis,cis-muconate cycloisomerase
VAAELGLADPGLPWHAQRGRVADLGHALARAAGTMAKIALDIALLSQTEVGEVVEPAPGGSSALPHKRNPVGSALVRACARGVWGQAQLLSLAVEQEQERAVGAWQSEWPALGEAFRFASGALATMAAVLEGLIVDEARMRVNLEAAGGVLMSESVMMALARKAGRRAARAAVEEAARAAAAGKPFRAALLADRQVTEKLDKAELDAALDPSGYLGAADVFVERALEQYRALRSAK